MREIHPAAERVRGREDTHYDAKIQRKCDEEISQRSSEESEEV